MIAAQGGEGAALGVFTVDETLVVRTWDAWLAAATGIPASRACGAALRDLVPDAEARGLIERFEQVIRHGESHVLAPAFHHYLFTCPTSAPSTRFDRMQQRVRIGPLRDGARIVGAIATVEDVTARLEHERALAEALRSPDPAAREDAARAVAAAAAIESPDTFSPLLGHDDWRVRRAATQGLGPHAHRDMLAAILKGLREGHRNFNVLSSALTLIVGADVDLSEPLAELLTDPDPDLRMQAALAFGEHQRPGGIQPLIGALGDPDVNVRFHAIEALGRLQASEAIDALADIAEAGDFFLAFPALDALARLRDPRVGGRLIRLLEQPMLESVVIDALGGLGGEEAVAPLVGRLNGGGPAGPIARALVRMHDRFEERYAGGGLVIAGVQHAIGPAGIQRLIDAASGKHAEDLRPLVVCLGWLRGAAVGRALTLLLGRPGLGPRAIEAVVRQGAGVVESLIGQLGGDDQDTRVAAIVALGRIGDRRATGPLTRLLGDDRAVALAAAGALAQLGDPEAFDPLLGLLAHEDAAIRQAAIAALNSIGHPEMPSRVAALMQQADAVLRESAVRIAGYFGYAECRDAVLACAADPEERVRRAALEQLPYVDDPRAASTLLAASARETPAARACAVAALAHLDDPAAAAALRAALGDDHAWVRYYAARALGAKRDGTALALLGDLARTDTAGHVRIAALEAIGSIDGPAALETLLPYSGADDDEIAAAALRGLARVSDPRALAALRDGARAWRPLRRLAAVHGLAGQQRTEALEDLELTAAGDPDTEVAAAATDALAAAARSGEAHGDAALASLSRLAAHPVRGERAIAAIAGLPGRRIAAIAARLSDSAVGVRLALVDGLGRMRDPDASAAIAGACADPDEAVRTAAVTTLDRLGARGIAPLLVRLSREDPSHRVRRAAASALSRTTDPIDGSD